MAHCSQCGAFIGKSVNCSYCMQGTGNKGRMTGSNSRVGCFVKDTKVLCGIGWREIQDLERGDMVLAYDMKAREFHARCIIRKKVYEQRRVWRISP